MKTFSKAAAATVLVLGLGGVAMVAPADAKKEEKPAAGPSYELSKEVRAAIVAAQNALAATPPDLATAQTSLAAVDAAAKNDDERYLAARLHLQIEQLRTNAMPVATRSVQGLVAPLDTLIANPRTPKEDLVKYLSVRGDIAYDAKQYPQALQFYTRARDLGFVRSDLGFMIASVKMQAGDPLGGAAELDALVKAEVAAGRKPPENWYKTAIVRLRDSGHPEETATWTANWLAAYGTQQNWRAAIYEFGFKGAAANRLSERQRIDLFRLMRATNSLVDRSEFINFADSAIKVGLPTEAKSAIEQGQGAGVIPSNNPTANDLLGQARQSIAADRPLGAQESAAAASPNGIAAAATGDAYLGARNYAKAAELYALARQKGGLRDADSVSLHYGIALGLAGSKDKARAAFMEVKTAPNTQIAKLWLAWLNASGSAA